MFPNDNVGQEAFAVIRDAMKGKGVVALGRIVLNKRERVIALEPFGKGLLGTTLHYAYEVRDAADYFDDIADVKISGEMLKLAQHIMEGKSGEFDPSAFEDHYETALVEMLKQKQAGFKPPKGKEKPRGAERGQPDGRAAPEHRRRSPHARRREGVVEGREGGAEEGQEASRGSTRDAAADRGQEDQRGQEARRQAGRASSARRGSSRSHTRRHGRACPGHPRL